MRWSRRARGSGNARGRHQQRLRRRGVAGAGVPGGGTAGAVFAGAGPCGRSGALDAGEGVVVIPAPKLAGAAVEGSGPAGVSFAGAGVEGSGVGPVPFGAERGERRRGTRGAPSSSRTRASDAGTEAGAGPGGSGGIRRGAAATAVEPHLGCSKPMSRVPPPGSPSTWTRSWSPLRTARGPWADAVMHVKPGGEGERAEAGRIAEHLTGPGEVPEGKRGVDRPPGPREIGVNHQAAGPQRRELDGPALHPAR